MTGLLPALLALLLCSGVILTALPRPAVAAQQPAADDDDPLPGQPGATAEAAKPIYKGMVIGCLGDEWTLPNPDEKMKINSYPVALEHLITAKYGANFVKVIVAGQKDATITEYEKLYDAKLLKAKPDLVIIQDSGTPNVATGFKMDLTKLVNHIKATLGTNGHEPKVMLLETFHDPEFLPMHMDQRTAFDEEHNWYANNDVIQQFAKTGAATFVPLRMTLGIGHSAMQDLNYTHPFRADGLNPTYIGATLISLCILQKQGEDPTTYNFKEFEFPDKVRAAMIGLVQGKQMVNGVPVEPDVAGPAGAGKVTDLLKNFDNTVRTKRVATVVYFGADMTFKTAWVAQNMAFLKRVYGPKVNAVNAGKADDTSHLGQLRLTTDVIALKPALVLIEFAFNDARDEAQISVDDSQKNLTAIVQALRKALPDCDVVLVTTHALNVFGEGARRRSDLESYYQSVRAVAKAQNTGLIDNAVDWTAMITADPTRYKSLMGGNLMPNFDGQAEIEKKVEKFFATNMPFTEPTK